MHCSPAFTGCYQPGALPFSVWLLIMALVIMLLDAGHCPWPHADVCCCRNGDRHKDRDGDRRRDEGGDRKRHREDDGRDRGRERKHSHSHSHSDRDRDRDHRR